MSNASHVNGIRVYPNGLSFKAKDIRSLVLLWSTILSILMNLDAKQWYSRVRKFCVTLRKLCLIHTHTHTHIKIARWPTYPQLFSRVIIVCFSPNQKSLLWFSSHPYDLLSSILSYPYIYNWISFEVFHKTKWCVFLVSSIHATCHTLNYSFV